ncbi:hypothetical protein JXA47_02160 [Candidatus Sumerlaeota bacterium]|nr:hypothetical protein [Candidatus Sumerlaeota bacterium]
MIGRSCASPWLLSAPGALLALALAQGIAAQNHRDLRRVEPQPFAVTDWGGELGFEFIWRREEQTSDRGNDFSRELRRFEECIELTAEGFVYHPLFIEYDALVRFGLLQHRFEADPGDSGSDNLFLNEYDITVRVLQEKPVSLRVRSQRRDDVVRDLFSDVIEFEEMSHGIDVIFTNSLIPSRLSLTHRDYEQRGFSSDSDSTLDTVEWVSHLLPASRAPTDFHWLHRDYGEDFTGRNSGITLRRRTDLTSHDLSATNVWRIDRDGRLRLTTSGRFYDQTGSTEVRQWRASERLDYEITPRLDSHLSYAYDQVETEAQTTRTHRARAGLHHRLYESLDTFAEARWRNTSFGGGDDETSVGGGIRFAYRKRTPRGLLSAGYSFDVDRIDRGAGGTNRSVTDEQVVLLDGVITFLERSDILINSIVVSDVTGLIVYVRDLDYRIIPVGDRFQIERIFGGAIANGELVLVDYTYFQPVDVAYVQIAQSFNVRHDWQRGLLEGLALQYRLADLRSSGDTGGIDLLEFTSHTFGMNYRWRWLEWIEEVEIFDANISPRNSLRSALHAHFSPWHRTRARAGIEYLIIDFTDSGEEDTDLLTLSTDLRTQLGRRTEWEIEALYRVERGRNDEDNFGVASTLRWAWRRLTAEVGFRWEIRDRSGTERDDIIAFVAVTREL